jgi:enamine deaminase RidA (YjgF/YER057c/UK114 family)
VGHKGTLIEIEPTAITAASNLRLERLVDDEAERCASMSAACGASGLTFLSGVPGLLPAGEPALRVGGLPAAWRKVLPARLPSGTDPAFAAQTAAVIGRLAARMKALGARLDRVAHLTLFVDDIDQFARMLSVFERAFGRQRPALYVVEVPKVSPVPGTRISATAIAWLGEDAPKPVALERSAPGRRRREN